MISEERIKQLAAEVLFNRDSKHNGELILVLCRAIEREALREAKVQIPTNTMKQEFARHQRRGFVAGYKQGQESMRNRAVATCQQEADEHGTDSDGWYICKGLSHQIEELLTEEPE